MLQDADCWLRGERGHAIAYAEIVRACQLPARDIHPGISRYSGMSNPQVFANAKFRLWHSLPDGFVLTGASFANSLTVHLKPLSALKYTPIWSKSINCLFLISF